MKVLSWNQTHLLGLVSASDKEELGSYLMTGQDRSCRDISVLTSCLTHSILKDGFEGKRRISQKNLILMYLLYCDSWMVKHRKELLYKDGYVDLTYTLYIFYSIHMQYIYIILVHILQ